MGNKMGTKASAERDLQRLSEEAAMLRQIYQAEAERFTFLENEYNKILIAIIEGKENFAQSPFSVMDKIILSCSYLDMIKLLRERKGIEIRMFLIKHNILD